MRINVRALIIFSLLIALSHKRALSQQFNFSLLSYAEQRLNPAYAAQDHHWSADILHRSQQTAPDFNINSSSFSFRYPHLIRNRENVEGGFGLNVLNDQSGSTNTFEVQEVGLSYALQFTSNDGQTLSFGISGFYHKQGFNFSNFLTNAQYIPDRGFDSSLSNGENLQELSTNYYRINGGILYRYENANGQTLSRLGFSIFDINHPEGSFFDTQSKVPPTYMTELAVSIYQTPKLNLLPTFLRVHHNKRNRLNIGLASEYRLANQSSLDFGIRYLVGRDLISTLELNKGNFSVGMAYDLSVSAKNSANTGAFEFGLKFKGLVKEKERKKKSKRKRPSKKRPFAERRYNLWPIGLPPYQPLAQPPYGKVFPKTANPVKSGRVSVEETYTFNYSFNSHNLNASAEEELNQILKNLQQDSTTHILITGHTDSVGSYTVNKRLSRSRAQTLADFLIKNGIQANRIQVKGVADTLPISDNASALGRAMNRRVEISIYR